MQNVSQSDTGVGAAGCLSAMLVKQPEHANLILRIASIGARPFAGFPETEGAGTV
jgi:hypothetical protein